MPAPKKVTHRSGATRWKVRFRDGTANASETFTTRQDALRFCKLIDAMGGAKARAIINETERDEVATHTVAEVAALWLEWKGAKRDDGSTKRVNAAYTITRYEQLIRNQINPGLGDMPLNLVSETDVQGWVDDLADSLAPKTCADAHSILHQIYGWAGHRSRGLAVIDPCNDTVLPKKRKNVAKGLKPAEWMILYQAALEVDADAADLLLFLVSSGWRWSEAVAPRVMDVDDYGPENGLWVTMGRVLRRTDDNRFEFVEDDSKSQAGMRRIKLGDAAAKMVRRRLVGKAPTDLVFTNKGGRRWLYAGFHSGLWTYSKLSTDGPGTRPRILQVARQRGLERAPDVDIHMVRHTHAVLLLLAGEPLAAVQKRMGHEDIRTTVNVYGSMISDVSDAGLTALDAVLAEPAALGAAGASTQRSTNGGH